MMDSWPTGLIVVQALFDLSLLSKEKARSATDSIMADAHSVNSPEQEINTRPN